MEQATTAFDASVLGIWPLKNIWEIYIKGGAALWDASSKQVITSLDTGASANNQVDAEGTDLVFGVGVGIIVGDRKYVRFGYDAFDTKGDLLAVNRDAGFEQVCLEFHWRF